MAAVEIETERVENPVDLVERIAATNAWVFERDDEDEISIAVAGTWSAYDLSFTWLSELEVLHLACAFDLRVPERRRSEVLNLIAKLNEQQWIGHFDLWASESTVMFRHSLLLPGGEIPSRDHCERMMKIAVEACERSYQAFQFVIWAGKNAGEALDSTLFETAGEA